MNWRNAIHCPGWEMLTIHLNGVHSAGSDGDGDTAGEAATWTVVVDANLSCSAQCPQRSAHAYGSERPATAMSLANVITAHSATKHKRTVTLQCVGARTDSQPSHLVSHCSRQCAIGVGVHSQQRVIARAGGGDDDRPRRGSRVREPDGSSSAEARVALTRLMSGSHREAR
jgi:hypothetical protein